MHASRRRSVCTALAVSGLLICGVDPATASAGPRQLCVGTGHGCYPTIQRALDAAHDGDTIRVAAGRFAGGISVTKSVHVRGAGQGATVIRGGGPVVTIGGGAGSAHLTVTLSGLTITGGVAHGDGVVASGGGIDIPAGEDDALGATVLLDRVSVTGNRAEATRTSPSPSGVVCPGGQDCPFARSRGGGISSFGTLTLQRSVISDNRAAGVASDANGGGIFSAGGELTLSRTVVSRNGAIASIPNGRFAEGGGVLVESGPQVSIMDSRITDNVASLRSALPSFADGELIEMAANSGGVLVGGDVATTVVDDAIISGNVSSAIDRNGEPLAIDAGMLVGGGRLTMSHTVISDNRTELTAESTEDPGLSGTALEVDGAALIRDTRIIDNRTTVNTPNGQAQASAGLAVLNFDGNPQPVLVRDSLISGNSARAISETGSAAVFGGGILNNGLLTLSGVQVRKNAGYAEASDASAQGGGIWNGVLLSGPPVELTLRNSQVTGNVLSGSPGADLQGGGLYTTEPITRDHAIIERNRPDQCVGCG